VSTAVTPRPLRSAAVREATAIVIRTEVVAQGVVALSFALPSSETWPWRAGDHVDVEIPDGSHRQYSLCGDPDDPQQLTIAVLKEPAGRGGSSYLHSLVVGDKVRLRGPRSSFPLHPAGSYRFVAGGIGITPILAMIREAERSSTPWTLLYGGRTRSSMAFLDELEQYVDRVRIVPEDEHGRPPIADWLGDPDPFALVYCCGPNGLIGAVETSCATWPAGSLHLERFTPREVDPPVLERPFEVQLARTARTLVVEPGVSILAAVRQAGVSTVSSCHEGTCGSCETAVLAGTPEHRDSVLDEADRAANEYMMICVSRSLTPRLVLDL